MQSEKKRKVNRQFSDTTEEKRKKKSTNYPHMKRNGNEARSIDSINMIIDLRFFVHI